jgi:MFS transporter, CP family, cyanate transporter
MLMGEFIGAGLTLPVMLPLLGGDWRAALLAWSLPALVVAVMVLVVGSGRNRALERTLTRQRVLNEGAGAPRNLVWSLGIMLGAASAGFFGANAYMASILAETGRGPLLPQALFWFNATQVLGSLIMLAVGQVLVGRRWPVILSAAGVPIGLTGFALGGDAVALTAVLVLGLSTCIQLILMVSLVPQLVSGNAAARLAAGVFTVGYLLGFLVPQAGGLLADLTGVARAALLPMVLLAVVGTAVAIRIRLAPGGS